MGTKAPAGERNLKDRREIPGHGIPGGVEALFIANTQRSIAGGLV
jgi:hypothetical protein